MKTSLSLTKYHLKLLFRDLPSVLMAFLMPIGFYVLFGYMLQDANVNNNSLTDLLIPLYIIIIIGNAVFNVFGVLYVNAKESGNLQKFKFLGVSELRFSFTLFVATLVFQLVVIISFILFTYFFDGSVFPQDKLLPILATLCVILVFHFAAVFFLVSLLKKSTAYNPIALTLFMYQMFLGGLTFPLQMFPEFLQKAIYYINPIIYGRDALLTAWTGDSSIGHVLRDNMILLSFSVGLVVAGMILNRILLSQKTAVVFTR
ncbi:ABC transporter permease [Paenibacillus daejeonensis]|uniref:ABC transporter permease n=1 Tax=Paenibacillus daejeonensis TaxID=135193 RepID=UPI000380151D|nr:ABC transporter permease [Paenibacillus daejeonensis]